MYRQPLEKTLEAVAKMTEQEYHELLIRLDERTQQILEQTTKTNGRVTKLETRVDCLESKNDTATGAKQIKNSISSKCYSVGEKVFIIIAGILIGRVFK
jgi:hypothetical protein